MGIRSLAAGVGCLAALANTGAKGELSVEFLLAPHGYVDAGTYGRDTKRHLAVIEDHLARLATRCLAQGESLNIRVLSLDLAGRHEWWHGPTFDLRVMRDITWPRMELDYIWRDPAGNLLGEGRELVADMNYLWRSPYASRNDELPYEKSMLSEWFERRFCRPRP